MPAVIGDLPQPLFDREAFRALCAEGSSPIAACKAANETAKDYLYARFNAGDDVENLIRLRARFVSAMLEILWQRLDWGDSPAALVAVGGFGRGELHPHSDVDLLILVDEHGPQQTQIEQFIALLWDIKLDIGHSVRTVHECQQRATDDLTILTALMESRLIAGDETLLKAMTAKIEPENLWPSDAFFRAKWDEQKSRHSKFADTEYNLEPNVKSSPGGLRDIQTIGWIAQRHYGDIQGEDLIELGFLTADELEILYNGRAFLSRVRYALHMISGREEDRLLFDHQRELASLFGFEDSDKRLAVEQLMQQYYRWVLAISNLNELLMQHFDQVILYAGGDADIRGINDRFQVRNGYIEVRSDQVFLQTPSALLEVFVICGNDPDISGVHSGTIRLLREHCHLIDDAFRASAENRQLFMDIMAAPHQLSRQLRRMNRYGILGAYLPEFGKIVGQMQHDLFHIYTVDAHTLEVVQNLRRFLVPEFRERFPVTSRVVSRLPRLDLLYVAGLFHDIGKGRGGDHSELGAVDAQRFCEQHGLNEYDTELVTWLVQNHLYMSGVAQRKDISDPEIIADFARMVGDQNHLDYLFALTVADINATNPTLWNAWRGSLLRQLYTETKRALNVGLDNAPDKDALVLDTQRRALEELEGRGFIRQEIEELWAETSEDYFLREKPEDVVWHTEAIAQHFDREAPLVLIKPSVGIHFEEATQIFIHARSRDYLFPAITASLEQLDLSVQDARLYSSVDGMALDTFFVLDANGQSISGEPDRIKHIVDYLDDMLRQTDEHPDIVQRRTPRQVRYFTEPTETHMRVDPITRMSVLEVATPDRPGLLARIGGIFLDFDIELQAAKITTLGERVEDVFFLTQRDGTPIEDAELSASIQRAICAELDQQASESTGTWV